MGGIQNGPGKTAVGAHQAVKQVMFIRHVKIHLVLIIDVIGIAAWNVTERLKISALRGRKGLLTTHGLMQKEQRGREKDEVQHWVKDDENHRMIE